MNRVLLRTALAISLLLATLAAQAGFAPFKVSDIEVHGNARIGTETVLNYVPLSKGQMVDAAAARQILKSLYATGFFKTAALFREGNRLIIKVVERPTIAEISAEGNELIKSEDLLKGLETAGIAKGRVYDETRMARVAQELRQRYQNMGYYGATVDLNVTPLPRNRVKVVIQVHEGKPATIGRIAFVGNRAYADFQLRRLMQLAEGEQYAKEQLQGDLDRIRDYYMNRGFAEFRIRSTQVRLSPDRQKVYLTINLTEGPVYHIGKVSLEGDLKLPRKQLESLLLVKPGQRFSRQNIVDSMNALLDRYSENAYANAEVVPEPRLDHGRRIADVVFHIAPHQRVYVRRIVIEGNTRTRDHVIRRELRQMEAAPYSLEYVRLSKKRLQKLGFFKMVDIQPKPVAPDLVDLHVKVEEQPTGSLTAAIGYSQLYGVTLSLGISERNALGSGNTVSLKLDTSGYNKTADLTLVNPYFTPNGVSLGAGLFWSEIDASQLTIGNYSMNTLGGQLFSTIPLNEDDSFTYGFKLSKDTLVCGSSFTTCNTFADRFGKDYLFPIFNAGWNHNSTNAFYFPTEGSRVSVGLNVAPPVGNDFGYAKLS
ncbi:outer membrane protein assembly factor BamA, partial [Sulfurivirga sp.]|uniref:outer membrane protein assembly factor BamA n=1 Tax=Sulfurivirga sp. TaxID=2614236 RepID=UPI0025F55F70